jgi:hypothetical protein
MEATKTPISHLEYIWLVLKMGKLYSSEFDAPTLLNKEFIGIENTFGTIIVLGVMSSSIKYTN